MTTQASADHDRWFWEPSDSRNILRPLIPRLWKGIPLALPGTMLRSLYPACFIHSHPLAVGKNIYKPASPPPKTLAHKRSISAYGFYIHLPLLSLLLWHDDNGPHTKQWDKTSSPSPVTPKASQISSWSSVRKCTTIPWIDTTGKGEHVFIYSFLT